MGEDGVMVGEERMYSIRGSCILSLSSCLQHTCMNSSPSLDAQQQSRQYNHRTSPIPLGPHGSPNPTKSTPTTPIHPHPLRTLARETAHPPITHPLLTAQHRPPPDPYSPYYLPLLPLNPLHHPQKYTSPKLTFRQRRVKIPIQPIHSSPLAFVRGSTGVVTGRVVVVVERGSGGGGSERRD